MKRQMIERMSPYPRWSARLALLSIPVLVIAAIGHRTGMMEAAPTFAAMALGFLLAALAIVASFAAFGAIWNDGVKGLGAALAGLLIALVVLSLPGFAAWKLVHLPRLTDISTDPEDPPYFTLALAERLQDANPVRSPTDQQAMLQRETYPDIVSRYYPLDTVGVFDASEAIVQSRGWKILESRAPANASETGRIEAVAQTLIFGFRQDVVIRIAPEGEGTLVDMRSAARYGAHDLGADAERIQAFLRDLDAALRGMGT